MGLFFFISGMLTKPTLSWSDKLHFLRKKADSQLLRYFRYNLLFAFITYGVALAGVKLGAVPDFSSAAAAGESLYQFFVTPFTTAHQYHLFIPSWFVLQLFVCGCVFQWTFPFRARIGGLVYLIVATVVAVVALRFGLDKHADARLLLIRTSFGLLFYAAGYVFQKHRELLAPLVTSPTYVLCAIFAVDVIQSWFGKITYSIVSGNMGNPRVGALLLSTLLIIGIVYAISFHVARLLKEQSWVWVVSRNSFYIMVFHLPVFFLVNCILAMLGFVKAESLADVYTSYRPARFWPVYLIPAVLLPVLLGEWWSRRKQARASIARA